MKYIVLNDIHGNYNAFEECIKDAYENNPDIDGFILMGDYTCEFPDGDKVIELIRKLQSYSKVYCIKGNRETGMTDKYYMAKKEGKNVDWDIDSSMGMPLLCCNKMNIEQLEFLYNMPETLIIESEGVSPLFLKHKMPLTDEEKDELDKKGIKYVLTAHTHESHEQKAGDITSFNAGSVGLTDEGIPGAVYGVLESNGSIWSMSTVTVDYDYEKTIESIRNNPMLLTKCKGIGKTLILSALTGVNASSLFFFELNRLTEEYFKSIEENRNPNFLPQTDNNDCFSTGRYANVDINGNSLTKKLADDVEDEKLGSICVINSHDVISEDTKDTKGIKKVTYDRSLLPDEIYDIAYKNAETYIKHGLGNDNNLYKTVTLSRLSR